MKKVEVEHLPKIGEAISFSGKMRDKSNKRYCVNVQGGKMDLQVEDLTIRNGVIKRRSLNKNVKDAVAFSLAKRIEAFYKVKNYANPKRERHLEIIRDFRVLFWKRRELEFLEDDDFFKFVNLSKAIVTINYCLARRYKKTYENFSVKQAV